LQAGEESSKLPSNSQPYIHGNYLNSTPTVITPHQQQQ
jgi:hypothetical protein